MEPKQEYPKYLFAKDGSSVLVQDAADHAARGADLKESPADWKAESEPTEPQKPVEPGKEPAKTYREHMSQWDSKAEKEEAAQAPNSQETVIAEPAQEPVQDAAGEAALDINAMTADLLKAGFKANQLKKKTDEEIKALHANLKG